MPAILFQQRRAVAIENGDIRVTVLEGGGHIAEILDKRTGINPLWIPNWPSVEPEEYFVSDADAPYGRDTDASLLAGIMGHSVCLVLFGGPSKDEAAAGLPAHGENSVTRFTVTEIDGGLRAEAHLQQTQVRFLRTIQLDGPVVHIAERIQNLLPLDRPIGWTQHVTLGPPFLEPGKSQVRMSAGRSKVYGEQFGSADYLVPAAEFDWPLAPSAAGRLVDLQVFGDSKVSSCMTAFLVQGTDGQAFFEAVNPSYDLSFGYRWRASDFPWIARWEENYSRTYAPWAGKSVALGIELGCSPFPESSRAMVDRGTMFGRRTYLWLPAAGAIDVRYSAYVGRSNPT